MVADGSAHHPVAPRRHPQAAAEGESDPQPQGEESALDPLWCQLAVQQSPFTPSQSEVPAMAASPLAWREDLQALVSGLARRLAWGGDRRKGSARLELAEGALAGATLTVHTEERSVSVELELPPGKSASGWQTRILERLEARGFSARVRIG